ncbi:MAG TPA: serine protease [Thermoanaerobaculia bacterium]|nr:serine protease [Thermoanaerobaculia bacterium]
MPLTSNSRDDLRQLVGRARAQLANVGGDPFTSGVLLESVKSTVRGVALESAAIELPGVDSGTIEATPTVAAHDVVRAAQEAIETVAAGGSASNLTDFQRVSLEAIVQLTGRPAMRYRDGVVQPPPNEEGDNERWRTVVATARSKINKASASVGQVGLSRADGGADPIGTAWRLGNDLVVTNRHVAALMVVNTGGSPLQWKYDPAKGAVVNFTVTDDAKKPLRFDISELLFCAEEQSVDFAVFRLAAGAQALPKALPLDFEASSVGEEIEVGGAKRFQGSEIYVVGHPFRAIATSATTSVFGVADGFKRCSPGLVTALSQFEHAFEHDASTLGGNSGSCVLSVSAHKVVGLHYGGVSVDSNQIGLANVALGLARLGNHRAAEILRAGKV